MKAMIGHKSSRKPIFKEIPAKRTARTGAAALPWPAGLALTDVRKKWHRRLSKVAPGLSLKQLVEQLGQPYASVAFWARRFNYPLSRMKRGRKSSINWDQADWSRRNSELARELGISGERVRQVRGERHLPPTSRITGGGLLFRQWAGAHPAELSQMSIRQMIAASGADISTAAAHFILKKARAKTR